MSFQSNVGRGRNKLRGLESQLCVYTSVLVSVGPGPAAPVKLVRCFC